MFGLPFYRHRVFETDWFWMQPGHPKHTTTLIAGAGIGDRAAQMVFAGSGAADGMGIDWMKRAELTQAVPPAYSEYLGKQLLAGLQI